MGPLDRPADGQGPLPPRGDPTDRAQAEQELADTEQRLALRERALALREQALTDAELADAESEDVLGREEEAMGRARERMRIAAERDAIATERDRAADERDRLADERDVDASIRAEVRARMQRDTLPPGHPLIELADIEQAQLSADRRAAAAARAAAGADRRRAAEHRRRAAAQHLEAARQREELHRERRRAAFDPLTGARRRVLGLHDLDREIDRARRELRTLVVAYVDVDRLEEINREHGGPVGDAALAAIASAIETRLRSHDLLVRVAGDEFFCAFDGLGIEQATERFQTVVEELHARVPPVSIRVGYAELLPTDEPWDLVERAKASVPPGAPREV